MLPTTFSFVPQNVTIDSKKEENRPSISKNQLFEDEVTATEDDSKLIVPETRNKKIKEIMIPLERFTYETDPQILDRLYEECDLDAVGEEGSLDDLLALPKAEFKEKKKD